MENKDKKDKKAIFKEILSYVIIILVVLFIKIYVVSPIRVNGNSMYDTLHDKDIMILNEFIYYFNDIKRNDIVVVEEDNEYLIKRVIGLPGERIKCENGEIYINDEIYDDKYSNSETSDFEEIKINNGEYFVLGDNRKVSLDSRTFGSYKKREIKGKATFTIFPLDRFGSKK